MKQLFLLIALAIHAYRVSAQIPEKLSYQAVIRNNNNQLDTNTTISMKISILQGSPIGIPVYVETHSSKSNANGLVTLQIGAGTVVSGSFAAIKWTNGPFYIRTETDPQGGNNYSISGTSELLSVPYALLAKTAENETDPAFHASVASGITASDTAYWNHKLNGGHYVGELFGGGVIFYVDQTGQHGLICAMTEAGDNQQWSNILLMIGPAAQSDWNGPGNTNAIISQPGHTNSAANDCAQYTNPEYGTGIFSDWYLPTLGQLIKLYNSLYEVNKALETDGNNSTIIIYKTVFWSSTEYNNLYAYYYDFHGGSNGHVGKENYLAVRAVRSF